MRRILFPLLALFLSVDMFSQAKLPKLMVVPSDVWCVEHHFVDTVEVFGQVEVIPDYKKALQSSRELMAVISKINILMADRGFPLQDLSQAIRSIQRIDQENSVLRTKESGAGLAESFRPVAPYC